MTIFLTLAYTPRPCSTALMMLAKLSSSRIMVAASRDTSVPVRPIATPISALLRAGASFTPSPVTATICSMLFSAETTCILCSGATRAKITSCGSCSSAFRSSDVIDSRSTPVITRTSRSPRTMPMRRAIASAVRP